MPRPNYIEEDSTIILDVSVVFTAELIEPLSYRQALQSDQSPQWIAAINEELTSLKENRTWSLVKLPEGRKAIDNRWVFRLKRKPNGDIERYKARLVVHEKIYMKQPEGFGDSTDRVCRLHRSLYGLKQAPRCWNHEFTQFLKRFDLQASKADSCVFFGNKNGRKIILALYIDDGLIAETFLKDIEHLLNELKLKFKFKSGQLETFLGLEISQSGENGSLFVNQAGYARRLLQYDGLQPSCYSCRSTSFNEHHRSAIVEYGGEISVQRDCRKSHVPGNSDQTRYCVRG